MKMEKNTEDDSEDENISNLEKILKILFQTNRKPLKLTENPA